MSIQDKRKFLYFYSKSCKFCGQFSEMLNRVPVQIKQNFVPICIDDPTIRLPPYLQVVPTIQIYDDGGRRHVLQDKHAFEWLNQYSQKPIETEAYSIGEMGSSLSDCYSFLEENENTKISSDRAYTALEQLESFFITTPEEGADLSQMQQNGNGGQTKLQADPLIQEMEKLQQMRSRDVPQKNGPPPQVPNFANNVGVGKDQENMMKSQAFQRQYDMIIQQRNADVPKRRMPSVAPNFESPAYKSQFVTQDMMKSNNQQRPMISQGSNFDYQKQVIPNIPKPTQNPNFGVSAKFNSMINNNYGNGSGVGPRGGNMGGNVGNMGRNMGGNRGGIMGGGRPMPIKRI